MTRCLVCNAENPSTARICATCGASLNGDPAGGATSALSAGTQLSNGLYAVGKVLGQGGFGITYLGSDARERRTVAIKEFFPHGSARRGREVYPSSGMSLPDFVVARDKFLGEAGILARFKHPGIVEVYASFDENKTAYMVMEFLRGRSLLQLLEERGPLPEAEVVGYIIRVGDALETVHRANLLHRDLKPDNVMLTDDGRVVLIDFGTARTYAAGKTGRMTTMLTPGYAPLEQYGQHVRFGPFTDIYALAATLYHLLTGRMPTDATDRATGASLPSPRELNPRVSVKVSDAVMWAMEVRVDRRPQTVREFIAALSDGVPSSATPDHPAEVGPSGVSLAAPAAPLVPLLADTGPQVPAAFSGDPPYRVAAQGKTLQLPQQCACCAEPADATYFAEHTGGDGPFSLFEESRGWEFPYCSQCLEHVRLQAETPTPGFGRLAAGPLLGAALGGPVGLLIGLGGAAVSAYGAAQSSAQVRELLKPTCVSVGPAVGYDGWDRDTHQFTFLNRDYANAFCAENVDSLVSLGSS
jgi:serine/threonine protein kinase